MACSRAVTSLPHLLQFSHPAETEPALPEYVIVYRPSNRAHPNWRGWPRSWGRTLQHLKDLGVSGRKLALRVERV